MSMKYFVTHRLVKGEDLNHHGTLFAGRSAEWFVESGFIAAAATTEPEHVVCLKIHGMCFNRPVHKGEVIRFESAIVLTGRSRIITHVQMKGIQEDDVIVDGFLTFVYVDDSGKSTPHNITVIPETDEEEAIQEKARNLS
jgi:acyl-CoA hydrolase